VSGAGDTGADPNKLVVITDRVSDTTAAEAANEKFLTLQTAGFGEVLRGVQWTPGTRVTNVANSGHGGFGQ
jgi:histidinol phosphatase-like enzyme